MNSTRWQVASQLAAAGFDLQLRFGINAAAVLQSAVADKEVDRAIAGETVQNQVAIAIAMNAATLGGGRFGPGRHLARWN